MYNDPTHEALMLTEIKAQIGPMATHIWLFFIVICLYPLF